MGVGLSGLCATTALSVDGGILGLPPKRRMNTASDHQATPPRSFSMPYLLQVDFPMPGPLGAGVSRRLPRRCACTDVDGKSISTAPHQTYLNLLEI